MLYALVLKYRHCHHLLLDCVVLARDSGGTVACWDVGDLTRAGTKPAYLMPDLRVRRLYAASLHSPMYLCDSLYIRPYNILTGRGEKCWKHCGPLLYDVESNPDYVMTRDGRYIFVAVSRSVKIIDTYSWEVVKTKEMDLFCGLSLSPQGNRLVAAGARGVVIWNLTSDTTVHVNLRDQSVDKSCWTPDERYIFLLTSVEADDSTEECWGVHRVNMNTYTADQCVVLPDTVFGEGMPTPVLHQMLDSTGMCVSSDGCCLYVACFDRVFQISTSSMQLKHIFKLATFVRSSPILLGTVLLVGDAAGQLYSFNTQSGQLLSTMQVTLSSHPIEQLMLLI